MILRTATTTTTTTKTQNKTQKCERNYLIASARIIYKN